jgi:hypothetical protein
MRPYFGEVWDIKVWGILRFGIEIWGEVWERGWGKDVGESAKTDKRWVMLTYSYSHSLFKLSKKEESVMK